MCSEEPARALPHKAPVRRAPASPQARELATSAYSSSHSGCALRGRLDSHQPSPSEVPMRLIGLAVVLAVSVLSTPLGAGAQQAERTTRIGFLSSSSPSDPRTQSFVEAFRQGLRGPGLGRGTEHSDRAPMGGGKDRTSSRPRQEPPALKVEVLPSPRGLLLLPRVKPIFPNRELPGRRHPVTRDSLY
jgi:hypothetical protein